MVRFNYRDHDLARWFRLHEIVARRLDLLQPTPPMDRHVVGAALRPGWVGLLAAGDPRRWSRSVCSSQPRKTMNSPHPCKNFGLSRNENRRLAPPIPAENS